MRYAAISGKVFSKKSDYMNAIVRTCARKLLFSFFSKSDSSAVYAGFA